IPVSGFYEWKRSGSTKVPYYIYPAAAHSSTSTPEPFFALAGIWEHWASADGSELRTCAVITTTPNELMRDIHQRMPVIVPRREWDRWLNLRSEDTRHVADLLAPIPADQMAAHEVSSQVNSPLNNSEACTRPVMHKE